MRWFADTLAASADHRVVYHESHDEAGNAENSGRTIVVAVNGAPLVGDTRRYAEARVRFAAGMTLAAAPATPMFFMGEEVGASQPYRYADVPGGHGRITTRCATARAPTCFASTPTSSGCGWRTRRCGRTTATFCTPATTTG